MITTKKDGTKIKEYLDPDDPRITEMGVTKRIRMPTTSNLANPLQTFLLGSTSILEVSLIAVSCFCSILEVF